MLPWQRFKVAPSLTHHLDEIAPAYEARFTHVMKFHPPGVAPVRDFSGAYHIDHLGEALYKNRFIKTFGYYEEIAAAADDEGWCHIDLYGNPFYVERYVWCGNFQEGKCPVQNGKEEFFHIDRLGIPLYQKRYHYVGDFKDGIAVVQRSDGKHTHIDREGRKIHSCWYRQLDVFHKGFSRAQDDTGWFHIQVDGSPIYSERYLSLEPFYNGRAHAQTLEGDLIIINEGGSIVTTLHKAPSQALGTLSGELVGFWKSETIRLAVEIKAIENPSLASPVLLRALWEMDVVDEEGTLTEKGRLLTPDSFMGEAALMWHEVHKVWGNLKEVIKEKNPSHHLTFKEACTEKEKLTLYQKVLAGYTREDFSSIAAWPLWGNHQTLIFSGQTGITLAQEILNHHPRVETIVLNRDLPIYKFEAPPGLQTVFQDPLSSWSLEGDGLVLPRFLHYFPDKEALQILKEGHRALKSEGKLYLFELVIDPENPMGGLMALNMLAESGGKLRTQKEWKALLHEAQFKVTDFQTIKPYLHLIIGKKNG